MGEDSRLFALDIVCVCVCGCVVCVCDGGRGGAACVSVLS